MSTYILYMSIYIYMFTAPTNESCPSLSEKLRTIASFMRSVMCDK